MRNKNIGLIISFLITCFCCFNFIFLKGNIDYLNSDTAAEIIHVLAMKENNSFFPNDWIGGSQLQLLSYVVYFFSVIFPDNLILARNFAQLLFACITFLCIILLHKAIFKNNSGFLMVTLCFCGLIFQYNRLYIIYAEYSQSVILIYLFIYLLLLQEY